MGRKLTLIAIFFTAAPTLLLGVILFCLSYTHEKRGFNSVNFNFSQSQVKFQALPENLNVATITDFKAVDSRIEYLRSFMDQYNSPLVDFVELIVKTADEYNLDYRLLPAIAMQESSLCKNIARDSDYNCWGFGIYGKKRVSFDGYDHAIKVISRTMYENYATLGLVEPEEIVTKYNPGSTTWAEKVRFFMEKIHPSSSYASASTSAISLPLQQEEL